MDHSGILVDEVVIAEELEFLTPEYPCQTAISTIKRWKLWIGMRTYP